MVEDLEHRLVDLLSNDADRMDALSAVKSMALDDWAIGAGFVRNAVWGHLHGFDIPTALDDIDILYFNPGNLEPARDIEIEAQLSAAAPGRPWSVRNQARMHLRNDDQPYVSTLDAMSNWLETPTCVGVRVNASNQLEVLAPYGLDDLFSLRICPTPRGLQKSETYLMRVRQKEWLRKWPKLSLVRPINTEIDSIHE
ncbi:MAG: nucleotidyltransferase family protein [Hyphomicrobiales bacterium]